MDPIRICIHLIDLGMYKHFIHIPIHKSSCLPSHSSIPPLSRSNRGWRGEGESEREGAGNGDGEGRLEGRVGGKGSTHGHV